MVWKADLARRRNALNVLVNKLALVHGGQGETKDGDQPRLVDDNLNKQQNLHLRLVLAPIR